MNRLTQIIKETAAILVRDALAEVRLGRPSDWGAQLLGEIRGTLHLAARLAGEMDANTAVRVISDLKIAKQSLEAMRHAAAA